MTGRPGIDVGGLVLVLNAGSSSLKFSLYEGGEPSASRPHLLVKGQVEGIGTNPAFSARTAEGVPAGERRWADADLGHDVLLADLIAWIEAYTKGRKLAAAGHRVVHGGLVYSSPVCLDARVLESLDSLAPLAPLHQPHNLAPIRALARLYPDLPQVACFDTAFHRTNPRVAELFALPRALSEEGIRRYGFHGLSYEYIVQALAQAAGELPRRVVVAHLGSGASMCAILEGRSVASTMGFTALDGLPMGTRSGSLDAGVLLYLMQSKGMDAQALEKLLYHQSGLLGVSGISNDMRTLLASEDARAREAVELFVYRIGRELGSLAAALGGLDAFVFTAGIGERSPEIRAKVCGAGAWLGLSLDARANNQGEVRISPGGAPVSVWAIPTDEEAMIARHTMAALSG